jgi:hypothetical protein
MMMPTAGFASLVLSLMEGIWPEKAGSRKARDYRDALLLGKARLGLVPLAILARFGCVRVSTSA